VFLTALIDPPRLEFTWDAQLRSVGITDAIPSSALTHLRSLLKVLTGRMCAAPAESKTLDGAQCLNGWHRSTVTAP
jgi:hypothetical protein